MNLPCYFWFINLRYCLLTFSLLENILPILYNHVSVLQICLYFPLSAVNYICNI